MCAHDGGALSPRGVTASARRRCTHAQAQWTRVCARRTPPLPGRGPVAPEGARALLAGSQAPGSPTRARVSCDAARAAIALVAEPDAHGSSRAVRARRRWLRDLRDTTTRTRRPAHFPWGGGATLGVVAGDDAPRRAAPRARRAPRLRSRRRPPELPEPGGTSASGNSARTRGRSATTTRANVSVNARERAGPRAAPRRRGARRPRHALARAGRRRGRRVDGAGRDDALHVACSRARPVCVEKPVRKLSAIEQGQASGATVFGSYAGPRRSSSRARRRRARPTRARRRPPRWWWQRRARSRRGRGRGGGGRSASRRARGGRDGRGFTARARGASTAGGRPRSPAFPGAGADFADVRLLARPPPPRARARVPGWGGAPLLCTAFFASRRTRTNAATAACDGGAGAARRRRRATPRASTRRTGTRAGRRAEPCPPALSAAIVPSAAADARASPDSAALRAACAARGGGGRRDTRRGRVVGGSFSRPRKGRPARPSALASLLPASWTRAAAPSPSPRARDALGGAGARRPAHGGGGARGATSRLADKAGELDDAAAEFERACARLNRPRSWW